MPLHFHLLDDGDLRSARDALDRIAANADDLLTHWYDLYTHHFRAQRTLSEAEFNQMLRPGLDSELQALIDVDFPKFVRVTRAAGEELVARGVPFAEVVVWTHLYGQAVQRVLLPGLMEDPERGLELLNTFDRVATCRLIAMGLPYFRAHAAEVEQKAGARARAQPLGESDAGAFHGIVGRSDVMRALFERIERAAGGRGTALIVGETGTGKELVARALHEVGDPPGAPFVPVNCAALPRELIESELFGHREGAFSGASTDYVGLVRAADGGTLFLDEVTEMHPDTQAKLLRVIQERTVRRVGTTSEEPVDVRIIASTNRDPMEAIRDRKLRQDLYYRLKVHTLRVPPLRERRGDLPLLCGHFTRQFNEQYRRTVTGIDAEALDILHRHAWPGNVRELMGVLESAFAFGRTDSITRRDLPLEELGVDDAEDGPPTATEAFESSSEIRAPRVVTFEVAERRLLTRALSAAGGNKSRAAKLLGISRKQLYAKIRKYGGDDGPDEG